MTRPFCNLDQDCFVYIVEVRKKERDERRTQKGEEKREKDGEREVKGGIL